MAVVPHHFRTVILNVPLMILLYTLTCMSGLVVYAYYTAVAKCDPLRNGDIDNSNQVPNLHTMQRDDSIL